MSVIEELHETEMVLGGELRAGGRGRFDDVSPLDGTVFASAPDADEQDMADAIAAARTAFDSGPWPRMSGQERGLLIDQLATAVRAHEEDFLRLALVEWGTVNDHASQIYGAAFIAAGNAQLAQLPASENLLGPDGTVGHQNYVPQGVVAAITPWNYPHILNVTKVTGAIAAGNTVVLKPSPLSPLAAVLLGRIIAEETDIPAGVVNVVPTSSVEVASALTADPRVDLVSFTGSTAVGRQIAATVGGRLGRVLLELGGKSPSVYLDDLDAGDLDGLAGRTLFESCTRHSGQACILTSRLLVPRRSHDDIVQRLADVAAATRVGDPRQGEADMGPMISRAQADKVRAQIDVAAQNGARIAFGGDPVDAGNDGAYLQPTILTGVTADMDVAQEEVFGPVLSVIAYDTDDEAVAIANNSRYGLVATVWGSEVGRAERVAERIRVGQVSVNGAMSLGPFGGFGESGIGREQGLVGLRSYAEISTVSRPGEVPM